MTHQVNKSATVIGISAVSGGGKTQLVKELTSSLEDAVPVYFDEFDDTTEHPSDMRKWISKGGDYDSWRAPELAQRLQHLKEGVAVDPSRKSAQYVVFDAPLGRSNSETGKYIDHMVFIDTPLDVAMARRILRDGREEWDDGHLLSYLDWGRELFTHHIERISGSSDLMLDGLLPTPALAQLVIAEFNLKSSI